MKLLMLAVAVAVGFGSVSIQACDVANEPVANAINNDKYDIRSETYRGRTRRL
jgi:hypothetical protein